MSLYLANLRLLIKSILFLILLFSSSTELQSQCSIKAFYLTTVKNKSILLIAPINDKYNPVEIKVNFFKIVYFNSLMIVLHFANKLKNFHVLIFRNQIATEQFKSLIILAKYGFIPN